MEPTLSQIDDYNGNESKEKKFTVYFVVGLLVALGIGYSMVKAGLDTNVTHEIVPYQYKTMQ